MQPFQGWRTLADYLPPGCAARPWAALSNRFAVKKAACPCTTGPLSLYQGAVMSSDPSETANLLHRAAAGDQQALAELFAHYRDRLRQMVRLRLDRRLQGR